MASLSLEGIQKVYSNGFQAVKDFNLEIADKEFIIFVGPSGCGKSTTLRMIAGPVSYTHLSKSSGHILYLHVCFVFSYLFRTCLLLIATQITNIIWPATPPIVLSRISSTSKLPTFVRSWNVSTHKLNPKLQNSVAKQLRYLLAIGKKNPNGINIITFPNRFVNMAKNPNWCRYCQNLLISLNRTRL